MRKFLSILFVLILLFSAKSVSAEASIPPSGFLKNNIWFSVEKLIEGETVKVFTGVWNGDSEPISGTVVFYDKDVFLGKKDFSLPGQTLKEVSIDWTVSAGDHSITAQILGPVVERTRSEPIEQFVPKKDNLLQNITNKDDAVEALKLQAEKAGEFIKESIPESATESVKSATSSVEGWRKDTGSTLEEKTKEVRSEIKSIEEDEKNNTEGKSTTEKDGQSVKGMSLKNSKFFSYAKLYGLKVLGFVFNKAWLFYGLPIIILVFIISLIRKKFKRENYS